MTRRARLYRDELKERHTPHWDLDLMPHDQLQELYERAYVRRRWARRLRGLILLSLLALCLVLIEFLKE